MKATFLQKKLNTSLLTKSLLEAHEKNLLWNSHRTTDGDHVVKKVEPIRGAE